MKKRIPALLLSFLILLSFCACGHSATSEEAQYTEPMALPRAEAAMAYDSAFVDGEAGVYSGLAMADSAAAKANGTASEPNPAETKGNPDKIIYSADTTVETTDFDATIAAIAGMMEDCGGWIESSSINGSNYYNKARGRVSTRSAHYSLRVPCEQFETIMGSLSTLGNVPYSHTYTENVTAQYYDTEARLKAYQTQETRLLEMLEIAETVEDVISIEEKLTELRYQIERLQSGLRNWDRQVSYSSISLSVEEVEEYTPETVVKPSYGQKLLRAFKDGVTGFVEFLAELLLFLIEALPTLLLLGLIVYGLLRLLRRRRKKKAQRSKDAAERKEKENS